MSEQRLRQVLAQEPGNFAARIALADLLAAEDRGVEALGLATAGLALAAAEQGRVPDDRQIEALGFLVRDLFRQGMVSDAHRIARLAGLELPQTSPGDGDVLRRSGDVVAAEAAYLWKLVADPGDAGALRGLSMVELRQGRPAEALAVARAGMAVDPAQPGLVRALAEAAEAAGDAAAAAEARGLAATAEPEDAVMASRAASAWARCGRDAEAATWRRRAEGGHEESLDHTLDRVPFYQAERHRLVATPLDGGNRNTLYRIECGNHRTALRLGKYPRPHWSEYWQERHNLRVAHGLGLAPAILYMDVADGTLAAPYVDGVLSSRRLRIPEVLARIGALYARLHAGPGFLATFDPLGVLDARERDIAGLDFAAIPDLADIRRWIGELRAVMAVNAPGLAPCHNDPNPSNFIDSPDGLLMVDWQTSAMADPDWEAGALLGRIPADDELRGHFLAALHGDADHPRALRVRCAEVLARYVEVVEGLQMSLEEPGDSGWIDHADRALAVVRARRDNAGFARAVTALRKRTGR
jgi:hypothetical protein